MTEGLMKWSGVSALIGGILAFILTPLMSIGYYQAYAIPSEAPPFWFSAAQQSLSFLFDFADKQTAYSTYGKLFAVVYLLFLPGVWALHKQQEKAGSKFERTSYVLLLIALTISFIGVSFDYWGIKAGWTLELLGMLLLQITATIYGISCFKLKIIGRLTSVLLIAAIPLCVIAFLLFKQIPSAPTLPFALASIAMGVFILRTDKTLLKS